MPTFAEVLRQLTPEARELLIQMVEAHMASEPGDREFMTMRTGAGTIMLFTGSAPFAGDGIDRTAMNDLASLSVIRHVRNDRHGNAVYDISPNSRTTYGLIMAERGGAVAAIEAPVRRLAESKALAHQHSGVSHHLTEALELLWSESTTDQTVSAFGAHLRSALADLAGDLTLRTSNPESVVESLQVWLAGRTQVRSGDALVEMAKTVVSLTQRLTHIRDETAKGRPLEGWHELRRAAFLASMLCFELAEVAGGR